MGSSDNLGDVLSGDVGNKPLPSQSLCLSVSPVSRGGGKEKGRPLEKVRRGRGGKS